MSYGKLYLIPTYIGKADPVTNFPSWNIGIVSAINHFFVENPKPARQFLKTVRNEIVWDEIHLYQFDKHGRDSVQEDEFLSVIKSGLDGGLLSDAGCPGVADPGNTVIQAAHKSGIEVIPLVGPSSILLTLMASGLNGQNFSFVGYLPKDKDQRTRELKRMSSESVRSGVTYLWIETPYRAAGMMEELLQTLPEQIHLCTGTDLMTGKQSIQSQTIGWWKKNYKRPKDEKLTVFAIGTY